MTEESAGVAKRFLYVNRRAPYGTIYALESLEVVLTNDALRQQFERNTPMRRPGTVEDIAACALYLASPAAAWVTGKGFQVDGGTEAPAISVPVPPL